MGRALSIAIVGAGMGGLTAALSLRKKNFDVTIFEKSSSLGEAGAGINLTPNAMKVLRGLDLEEEIVRISCEPDSHLLRNWKSGRIIHKIPIRGNYENIFGAGYLMAQRADLHSVLRRPLPESCIRLDALCTGARTAGKTAILTLAGSQELEFDAVIGADGINSAIRESLFGPDRPRFTGNICWRGSVRSDVLPKNFISADLHVWLGPHGHVVNYHVRGGELVNFVATYEADDWRSESWSVQADRSEPLRTYSSWNPEMLMLFENASSCYKWAMYDRDPLAQWTVGRVSLLGDAAHPMLPHLAQGAAMAMEDGFVLGEVLSRANDDVTCGLKAYEALRAPRTSRVQLGARAQSKKSHLTSPLARLRRDIGYAVQRWIQPKTTSYKVDWIYAYDVMNDNTLAAAAPPHPA